MNSISDSSESEDVARTGLSRFAGGTTVKILDITHCQAAKSPSDTAPLGTPQGVMSEV